MENSMLEITVSTTFKQRRLHKMEKLSPNKKDKDRHSVKAKPGKG